MKRNTDIIWYIVAIGAVSLSNFATVPLLVNGIGSQEFARWALIEPIILLLVPFAGIGLNVGLLAVHSSDNENHLAIFPFHIVIALALSLIVGFAMFVWTHNLLLSIAVSGVIFIEGTTAFLVSFWRAANKPIMFAGVEGGRALILLVTLSLAILSPDSIMYTVADYLYVRLVVGFVFLFGALLMLKWRWKPDRAVFKEAVAYGLPIVIASLLVVVIMNMDRYGVAHVADEEQLTGYVAHTKLAMTLGTAVSPFWAWFAPRAIKIVNDQSEPLTFLTRSFYIFFVVNVILALSLWMSAPLLWPLLFPSVEFNAFLFSTMIFGMLVFACGNVLSVGTLVKGRTNRSIIITVFAGLIGLLLGFLLTPKIGVSGIVVAKATAMVSYSAMFAIDTVRTVSVTYKWGRMSIILIFAVLWSIFSSIYPHFDLINNFLLFSLGLVSLILLSFYLYRGWSRE